MAEDEIQKLAGNLTDLNKVTLDAGIEFQGMAKKLIKMSDSTSRAGKKWTIFSRIVSGSPIWKIQNKIRAFIDVLAQIEQSAQANSKAAKEQEQRIIDTVSAYQSLEKPLKSAIELQKKIREGTPIPLKQLENKELKEAIKGTHAYNLAILQGVGIQKAQAKGLNEIIKKGKQQRKNFETMQEQAKFNKNMGSKKGRKTIDADISNQISNIPSFRSRVDEGIKKKIVQFTNISGSILDTIDEIKNTGVFKFIVSSIKKNESLQKLRIRVMLMLLTAFKIIKPIFSYLFKVLIIVVVVMALIVLAAKLAFDTYDLLNDIPQFMILVMAVIDAVLNNIMLIFNMIGALLSGDMYEFIEYALDFFDNLLIIGLGLLGLALGGLFALAAGVVYSSLDTVYKYFNGLFGGEHGEFSEAVNKILLRVLIFFAVLYFVKQVALVLLHVALTKGFYILLILGIGAAIIGGIKFLIKNFKLPFFADGGVSDGGMAVVGERGPELVNLPKGARVHSNRDSRKMSSSVINNNVSVTINAKDTSDAELRRIADQVGSMITNKLNRTTSSSGFIR